MVALQRESGCSFGDGAASSLIQRIFSVTSPRPGGVAPMTGGRRTLFLAFLAAVFSVGLTFATVELPYLLDDFVQRTVMTPGFDSGLDAVSQFKTELFIAHYRLRTIGYVCFTLLVGLIVVGFATRRTGLATLGALGFMLPVFAQFAAVMFFLSGLGALNVLWLPVLDLSFSIAELGEIIRAPYDLLRWLLALIGVNGYWPIVWGCLGGGGLIFFVGTYVWLAARARGQAVADFWIYRISRHPQYLGWIVWSYGVYLLLLAGRYPRRSWGIDASLPWLVSTLVIVGVAMLEEIGMRRRYGEAYARYRRTTPFLFPVPSVVASMLRWPTRLLFRKDVPARRREVAILIPLYAVVLMGASALFYGGLGHRIVAGLRPAVRAEAQAAALASQIVDAQAWRPRYALAERLLRLGDAGVDELLDLLRHPDPQVRQVAIWFLRASPAPRAVPQLEAALSDPVSEIRGAAIQALVATDSARVPVLLPLLDDSVAGVRASALRALATLGAGEILPRSAEFLRDSSVWIRVSTIESLGVLGAEAAVPLLMRQLADTSAWVRRATVTALVAIGSPAARGALQVAAADDDWEVRVYAAEGLKRLGP